MNLKYDVPLSSPEDDEFKVRLSVFYENLKYF